MIGLLTKVLSNQISERWRGPKQIEEETDKGGGVGSELDGSYQRLLSDIPPYPTLYTY